MEEQNRAALKEWAAVDQALATGKLSLLLRKGGIWERREGFAVEHREFWIFPTRFHQNPAEIHPAFRDVAQAARTTQPDLDTVRIGTYAVVQEAWRIERAAVLDRLEGLHPLSAAAAMARFRYRDQPYVHAILLRAYRLPEPHLIPNTLGYEGCVSWVELDEALSSRGAIPALSDPEFADRHRELQQQLEAEGVARL